MESPIYMCNRLGELCFGVQELTLVTVTQIIIHNISGWIKGELQHFSITSWFVDIEALSRMVKVSVACDKPFLRYSRLKLMGGVGAAAQTHPNTPRDVTEPYQLTGQAWSTKKLQQRAINLLVGNVFSTILVYLPLVSLFPLTFYLLFFTPLITSGSQNPRSESEEEFSGIMEDVAYGKEDAELGAQSGVVVNEDEAAASCNRRCSSLATARACRKYRLVPVLRMQLSGPQEELNLLSGNSWSCHFLLRTWKLHHEDGGVPVRLVEGDCAEDCSPRSFGYDEAEEFFQLNQLRQQVSRRELWRRILFFKNNNYSWKIIHSQENILERD